MRFTSEVSSRSRPSWCRKCGRRHDVQVVEVAEEGVDRLAVRDAVGVEAPHHVALLGERRARRRVGRLIDAEAREEVRRRRSQGKGYDLQDDDRVAVQGGAHAGLEALVHRPRVVLRHVERHHHLSAVELLPHDALDARQLVARARCDHAAAHPPSARSLVALWWTTRTCAPSTSVVGARGERKRRRLPESVSMIDEPPSAAASPSALDEPAMPPWGTTSMALLDEAAIESESESAERRAREQRGTAQGSRIPSAAQCTNRCSASRRRCC